MLRLKEQITIILLLLSIFRGYAEENDGVILARNLNLRVKPGVNYTKVASLKKDTLVKIVGERGEWYELKAPKKTSVWVAKRYITNNVIVKNVNARSGPGVVYTPFQTIPMGTDIEVIDDSLNDWVMIKPLEYLTVWGVKKYIQIDIKMIKQPEKPIEVLDITQKESEDEKKDIIIKNTIVKTSDIPEKIIISNPINDSKEHIPKHSGETTTDKKVPEDYVMNTMIVNVARSATDNNQIELSKATLTDIEQGKAVLPFIKGKVFRGGYDGILLNVNDSIPYLKHAIVSKMDKEYFAVCYLHSDSINLDKWIKKRVSVTGMVKFVKGWKRPVLIVDKIRGIMGEEKKDEGSISNNQGKVGIEGEVGKTGETGEKIIKEE